MTLRTLRPFISITYSGDAQSDALQELTYEKYEELVGGLQH